MYNRIKQLGIVVLVTLLITALLVPSPSTAQAEKPEWEEGDAWAMGFDGDIQDIFSPGLDMIDEALEEIDVDEDDELEEIDYDVEGELGFYQIYEVTEVNDDGYVMEVESGGGIQASASFEITGEMPEEGEYDMEEQPDMETKTFSVEGELFFMLDIERTIHYDEDLAIEEMYMDYTLELSAEFSVENYPSFDYDWENEIMIVEYEDFSGGISVELGLQLQMEFEPALDVFQFPIEEHTSWTAESNMTVSGSYEGVIDLDYEEMPEEFQEMIDQWKEEEDIEFPIILEDIDTEEDEMNFGEIEETTEDIEIPMKCTGTEEIVLYDGTVTDAYILEFGTDNNLTMTQQEEASFQMMYSADAGFMVLQQMNLDDEMDDEIGQIIDMEAVQMESMDVEEARESMEEMQEEEKIPGFTLALLTLGAVVAVAVYYKKKQ